MTFATLLVALIATSAPAADAAESAGNPVLLDFGATWCGPCRQMRPTVEKMAGLGYPIREVDIDRSPDLCERYNVKAVPTFIVVDPRGKTLARASGAMPPAELAALYNNAKLKYAAKVAAPAAEEVDDRAEAPGPEPADDDDGRPEPLVNPKPWETVVRIKMHLSNTEWGYGSGTIIYSDAEQSIILTCAHIFRVNNRYPQPKDFRVPISVDLFGGQFVIRQPATLACVEKDIPGEAIDYDPTNDVGLIRIRPGRKLKASRVVPPWWHPQRKMQMYTVGCSHGHDATAWDTMILDPKVTMSNTETHQGFSEIKCVHQPMEGRSGGGLYTTDGYVAGVCDFADPNEKVGLYAVPEAIHRLLDRNRLTALYKPANVGSDGTMLASNGNGAGQARPGRGAATSPNTIARLQSDDPEPKRVTLPPPGFVGIDTPRAAEGPRVANRSNAPRRGAADLDPNAPNVRPGPALPTGAEMDPGPDARAFEIPDPIPAPAPPRRVATQPTPAPGSSKPSGWKRAQERLPDLAGEGPGSR